MLIRYVGGRSRYDISFNRKPYYFTPENNRILDIKEQLVINYIFSLPNRAEFEAVIVDKEAEEPKEKILKCLTCGFIAKSEQGLLVHNSKHKKGGK